MDKEYVINEIKKLIPLIKENIPLNYLVLFGSYATGKQHNESDIDLAIVSEGLPKGILNDKTREILKSFYNVSTLFEPHFYRLEKWENPPEGSFLESVKQNGEIIYKNYGL